jgi:FkbM family methyltransferase
MRNIYIDCGTHLGEGLKKHIEMCGIDETWEIYTFEANPNTFKIFQEARKTDNVPEKYKWIKWENIEYFNKAVWTEDGEIDFYCSTVSNRDSLLNESDYINFLKFHDQLVESGDLLIPHQRSDYNIDGSSTIMPNHFKNVLSNGDSLQRNIIWEEKVSVDSFDFSKWLKENIKEDDNVICKIDIEGAEFDVIKKCITDDTLRLINSLDVEFHHFSDSNYSSDYHFIMNEVNKLGINFNIW